MGGIEPSFSRLKCDKPNRRTIAGHTKRFGVLGALPTELHGQLP